MTQLKETKSRKLSRRHLLAGGAIAAMGFAVVKKPRQISSSVNPYFEDISKALRQSGIGKPTLIIDRARLNLNIDRVIGNIPNGMALRIAQKSVPSLGLMNAIIDRAKTNRLMVFNQDFLQAMSAETPYYHILLGKPLPIAAARSFYDFVENSVHNAKTVEDIEWLIDGPTRLQEYVSLAREKDLALNINVELDVGMHRGGVKASDDIGALLREIRDNKRLTFSGFMGYEKHIVYALGGARGREKAKRKCWEDYQSAKEIAVSVFGNNFDPQSATLNGGGSATYRLYEDTQVINDICLGSAFTMPSHFDFDTLSDHVPAAFIASPILKQSDGLDLPGAGILNTAIQAWNPNKRQTFFYYGGRWMADPVYPEGLSYNQLYGRSSNQEMLNGSVAITLEPNDFVYFRPQESEAVFLQFGDIAVYEDGEITEFWPVLPAAP